MAIKALGKNELKELGCNFVVANVPLFAAVSDSTKTNKMQIFKFKTFDDVKTFFNKNTPIILFDQTGVYKDKADLQSSDDGYYVRCCPLIPKEFESLRSNLKETENLNFSFKFDFSCWYPQTI